jgi:glycosyltransferase involved in cell wall biosynthesis
MNKILLIESCNFLDFPIGGQLSYCLQLIETFPSSTFALVGITTDEKDEVGRWQKKKINGAEFDYLPVYYTMKSNEKGIIPNRMKFLFFLKKFSKTIFSSNYNKIFVHAPESLFSIPNISKKTVFYFFHGLNNPLKMPRYWYGRLFSNTFQKYFLRKIKQCNFLGAASGNVAIADFISKNNIGSEIYSMPTRFDNDMFYIDRALRSTQYPLFCFCGRLNLVKGWALILESFNLYCEKYGKANLVFIGDGEDRGELENMITKYNLNQVVSITGYVNKFQVNKLYNRASALLVGSYHEGWSISMVEALGCGLPIISTKVSGTEEMIDEGQNGYVLNDRDPHIYAKRMYDVLELSVPNTVSIKKSHKYRKDDLKDSLLNTFPDFFN